MTLRIVVPDGPLREPSLDLLTSAGVRVAGAGAGPDGSAGPVPSLAPVETGHERPEPDIVVATVAPGDVPSYVRGGAAELGFVARDVLLERETGLCELLDLRFGRALLVYAETPSAAERAVRLGRLRVATCHPRLARSYFAERRRPVEIVVVQDAPVRAATDGLADGVVVLVSPSDLAHEPAGLLSGLTVADVVAESTVLLVASRGARALHHAELGELVGRLRPLVGGHHGRPQGTEG